MQLFFQNFHSCDYKQNFNLTSPTIKYFYNQNLHCYDNLTNKVCKQLF